MKKCKTCRTEFAPTKPMQSVCSPSCALSLASSKRAKALKVEQVKDKRETKQKLDRLKSKAQWAKEAQTEFNRFIRLRDSDQPCISCGRHHQGQYHAGHYLSVGARPELRFTESNVHKQCAPCNTHLSGNAVLYRKGLIAKIGIELVEWLEGSHTPRKYWADALISIKREYAAKARALEAVQ